MQSSSRGSGHELIFSGYVVGCRAVVWIVSAQSWQCCTTCLHKIKTVRLKPKYKSLIQLAYVEVNLFLCLQLYRSEIRTFIKGGVSKCQHYDTFQSSTNWTFLWPGCKEPLSARCSIVLYLASLSLSFQMYQMFRFRYFFGFMFWVAKMRSCVAQSLSRLITVIHSSHWVDQSLTPVVLDITYIQQLVVVIWTLKKSWHYYHRCNLNPVDFNSVNVFTAGSSVCSLVKFVCVFARQNLFGVLIDCLSADNFVTLPFSASSQQQRERICSWPHFSILIIDG